MHFMCNVRTSLVIDFTCPEQQDKVITITYSPENLKILSNLNKMVYILLLSGAQEESASRSFNEFKTKEDLAQHLIVHFEDYLEKLDGQFGEDENLQYGSEDLFEFIDKTFGELVCLEKQPDDKSDLFIPNSSSWIKETIYLFLKNAAEAAAVEEDKRNLLTAPFREQVM